MSNSTPTFPISPPVKPSFLSQRCTLILDINPQAVIASIDPTPSGRFARVQFTHPVLLPYAYMNKTYKYACHVLQIRVPMRLAATVGEGEVVRLWVNENYMPRFVPELAHNGNSVQEVSHV